MAKVHLGRTELMQRLKELEIETDTMEHVEVCYYNSYSMFSVIVQSIELNSNLLQSENWMSKFYSFQFG